MDDIAREFGLPRGAEPSGMFHCVVHADEQFSKNKLGRGLRGVIEGYDVGRTAMMKVRLIKRGHFIRADQVDAKSEILQAGLAGEHLTDGCAEEHGVDTTD